MVLEHNEPRTPHGNLLGHVRPCAHACSGSELRQEACTYWKEATKLRRVSRGLANTQSTASPQAQAAVITSIRGATGHR
jgi:hypothetical protein